MTDLSVQRTLVKSPPELWSELSEVEGLARHLGEFGEIRITRAAPETTVAWEGDHASGTVEIEPSGWGTKVTLTALVSGAASPEPVAEPVPGPVEPEAEPVRLSEELGRIAERAQASYWEELVAWGDHDEEPPAPKPRWGRWSRFFRRHAPRESIEAVLAAERLEDASAAADGASATAPTEMATPPPTPLAKPTPVAEPTLEPDHARAVLEHALDNLGAAHHRPFSRG